MLSIEKCKKILNKNGKSYNDDQVGKIREFLYTMAMIEYRRYEKKKQHDEKESNIIPEGIDR